MSPEKDFWGREKQSKSEGEKLLKQRLEQIRARSKVGDVTTDLRRFFGDKINKPDSGLLEIQKQGFISEAVAWLKAITPEGMRFGTKTREERLAQAQIFAKRADTTTEEIVKKYNIQLIK